MLRDKIKEYLDVTGAADGLMQTVNTANAYMIEQLKSVQSPDEMIEIKALNDKYMAILNGRLDEFYNKYIDLYAEFYTEEDIDALLLFNNSPVAKKMRDLAQPIFARTLEISADFNKELLKHLSGATLNREVN